jgi:hypothetical protein
MSGPQPTPVPGPTPTPDVSHVALPNVPSNTYELLTSFAAAIDTATGNFTTHATKLASISHETDGAVSNVVSTSQGLTTQTLSDTWGNTKTDFSRAHDPLTGITASTCLGGSPNGVQAVLDKNKSTIQDGLIAIEKIRALQRSSPLQPPSAQQVQQWIDQVNAFTGALGNVNLALEVMILSLRKLNGGFAATCATGFAAGVPLPTFPKNAFAMNSSGGGGGGTITAQQLSDFLKGKGIHPSTADDIALWAEENHLNLDDVNSLVTKDNASSVLSWLQDGKLTSSNLNDALTLNKQGISTGALNQLLNSGADLSKASTDVTALLNSTHPGVNSTTVSQWIEQGLNLKYAKTLLDRGATVDIIDKNIGNYTNPSPDPNAGASLWNKMPKSQVVQVFQRWETGVPSGQGNDGSIFANRVQASSKGGSATPFPNPVGQVREYYVNYPGSDRILIDESGRAYYYPSTTSIHYDPGTRIPIPFSYILQMFGK